MFLIRSYGALNGTGRYSAASDTIRLRLHWCKVKWTDIVLEIGGYKAYTYSETKLYDTNNNTSSAVL